MLAHESEAYIYGIVRQYSGAVALIDLLERQQTLAAERLRVAPGFIRYHAIRTEHGLTTVSVCEDRAGAEETTRIAAQFVRDNLSAADAASVGAPTVSGGEIVLSA